MQLINFSLIYSYWTSTLDVVAQALDNSGITHVRYDGRVPLKARVDAVQKLQNDPKVQVMLLTISCGGVGYALHLCNPKKFVPDVTHRL